MDKSWSFTPSRRAWPDVQRAAAVGSWWGGELLPWLSWASAGSWWEKGGSGRDAQRDGDVGSWEKVVGDGLGRVLKTFGLEKRDVVSLGKEGGELEGCSTCNARQPRVALHTLNPSAGSGTEKRRNECLVHGGDVIVALLKSRLIWNKFPTESAVTPSL